MHDELRELALRRIWWWTALLLGLGTAVGALATGVALLEPTWPLGVRGGTRSLVAGGAAGAVGTVLLLVAGEWSGTRRAWPTIPLEPVPGLVAAAHGLALARGEPTPRVWQLESNAPNVACLPRPRGRHLVVSRAARVGLAPDELEAVMALQFSLLVDPQAGRLRRRLVTAGLMMTWNLRLWTLAGLVVVVREPIWTGLTVNVAMWLGIASGYLVHRVQRRLRWAWGVMGDAVAVETTRHPQPLVRALRRLAGHNGGVVPVRRTFGAADPYWAVSVRARIQVATMVVNGRARRRTSTEQVSDAALLLRAGIVERVLIHGAPATVASWRAAAATFDRLALAAGDGTVVDASIDGVSVGVDGAADGALPPVTGSWPTGPAQVATLRDFVLRSRRPRPPDADALAAYDGAVVARPA